MDEIVALIPAAGYGRRIADSGRSKAFINLGGFTYLEHVVRKLAPYVSRTLVALPANQSSNLANNKNLKVIIGGDSRQKTIELLLAASDEKRVLIHDVARPLFTSQLIERVISASADYGAVVAALSSDTSIMAISGCQVCGSMLPSNFLIPQSPQVYYRNVLEDAFTKLAGYEYQTVWEAVLSAGYKIKYVEGERTNFKVTYPEDIVYAEAVYGELQ